MADLTRINTNITALNALNNLNNVNNQLAIHQLRLSTGKKINNPSDDPAGWAIATKLRSRADGLGQALNNINSAKDMIAVGEGHLQNIQSILEEMRVKAEEAASDALGDAERDAILNELQNLNSQINMEVDQAQWNDQYLLKGTSSFDFQIGVKTSDSDSLSFNIANEVFGGTGTSFNTSGLEVTAEITGATLLNKTTATSVIDSFSVGTFGYLYDNTEGDFSLQVSNMTVSAGGTVIGTVSLLKGGSVIESASATFDGSTAISATLNDTGVAVTGTGVGISSTDFRNNTYPSEGGSFTLQDIHSVSSQTKAQTFMNQIDDAIDKISEALSYTGAITNRLTYQESSLTTAQTRTDAARSTIEDADMAYEQLEATKLMILQQTATAMLAQANMAPQNILTLFGG